MISVCSGTRRHLLRALVGISLWLLAVPAPTNYTLAQSATATLSGTVGDEKGAVIPGVKVTLTNSATKLARQTVTDSDGYFSFALLPPGGYTLTAQRDGFAPTQVNDLNLNVNDQRALRVQLRVGGVNVTVNVTDGASLLDESASVSTVIDRQFVANLPLNGRSFQSLLILTPGVVLTRTNFAEEGQFSVNGQRTNTNYFTVDGVGANFAAGTGQSGSGSVPALTSLGGTNNLVSVDALQEFKIQTSTYAPEFGRTPGAQVSLVTRSGTNAFHGSLFEYFRNDKLDATDWFANQLGTGKPPFRHNQFGGSFGGPLLLPKRVFGPAGYDGHNRTYFFFAYEGLRLRQPQVAQASVISVAARQRVSDIVRPLVDAYPLPNGPALGNELFRFAASYSAPSTLNASSLRVDHLFGNSLNLFGRFNYAPSSSSRRTGVLSQQTELQSDTQTLTIGATHTISPRVVHDTRVNLSRAFERSFSALTDFGGAVVPTEAQIYTPFGGAVGATIGFNVGGGIGYQYGPQGQDVQRQFNLVDSLSLASGPHQWKFGVDYRYLWPTNTPRSPFLAANFAGVAGLLTGIASTGTVSAADEVKFQFHNFSAYAQDTWKANPRLTLTYGVRWEVNPPPSGRHGQTIFTFTDPSNLATVGLAPTGTPLYQTRYGNFAPRFGFAYQLIEKRGRELSIRGGAGLFYDLGVGTSYAVGAQFPIYQRSRFPTNAPFPFSAAFVVPNPLSTNPPFGNIRGADPNIVLPRTWQFNLTLEQALGTAQSISAAYVGALGRKLLRIDTIANPNPNVTNLLITRNQASSDYQALQLQFTRRLHRGLQALASYTWSHSIDTASNDSSTLPRSDIFRVELDRASSDFDVQHAFSAALSYALPGAGGSNALGAFTRNWGVDAIVVARTALPINVTMNRDFGFGSIPVRPDIVAGIPIWLDDPTVAGGRRINNTLNPANRNQRGPFVPATGTRQGTLSRNALRGFGLNQINLALRRRFPIGERLALNFRGELFNLFNHPNFTNPESSLGTMSTNGVLTGGAMFGQSISMLNRGLSDASGGGTGGNLSPIYQVGGARSVQLALRIEF